MMKAAMRQALKEALLSMKKGIKHERASSYMEEGDEEDADLGSDSTDADQPRSRDLAAEATKGNRGQAGSRGLREKVEDTEHEAREEMAGLEDDDDENWEEERREFLKGRPKSPSYVTARFVAKETIKPKAMKSKKG